MHIQWYKEIPKAISYRLQGTIGLDWSPLVNATTLLCCSHPGKTFNEGRPIYYMIERDGWDELRMRGLVSIDKSSMRWVQMGWVRVCRKGCAMSGDRVCLDCVSRAGQDCVGKGEVMDVMESGWTSYNKMGWVGFIIMLKVSY